MDEAAIARTELLAPIIRGLQQSTIDYKELSIQSLKFFGFEELGYALIDRRQDWEKVFKALRLRLQETPAWIRIQTLLSALSEQPQELGEIVERSGLAKATVSQTINALQRGGYAIPFEHLSDRDGRPRKVFYRRS